MSRHNNQTYMRSLLEAALPKSRGDIEKALNAYFNVSGTYEIDGNGVVNVNGNIAIKRTMDKLPVVFGDVKVCRLENAGLTTLEGSPEVCTTFDCSNNELTSLEGGPRIVIGHYLCIENKRLTSLIGAPKTVTVFNCGRCGLTSLEGGPSKVTGYVCDDNQLKSLVGIAEDVKGWVDCDSNPLESLKGLKSVGRGVSLSYSPNLPLLSLIAYDECIFVDNVKLTKILAKHCSTESATLRKRLIACQKELIDAGFAGNARM
jgi:Leucine-rich repeat (LRR) protein